MREPILLASPKAQSRGFGYAIFASAFLPAVLGAIPTVLGRQLHILTLNTAYFSINFLILVLIFRRFLLESLRLLVKKWKTVALIALLGFLVYLGANWLLTQAITQIAPDFYNRNNNSVALMAEKSYFLTAFGTVFLVPVAEECMFRAGVFGSIYRKKPLFAYFFSTILFALVHIDGFFGVANGQVLFLSFLQYLPAGVILATAYDISGSIFAPIFIHMAVNALGMLALR
jgi:membrane protease YdiL (CAAX protease family)